ncbi:MAG TPA: hypothetical protein VJX70_09255 [Candidatus Acidoferrum sp.]|nr:hypothetical protein [Candidatus Acidoferrum sp.]
MKLAKLSLSLLGAALLFSSAALANDSNKSTLNLSDKITVEGKTLDAGKYTIVWDGAGPNVQVTVLRNKQTVATFPAHVVDQPARNTEDAYSANSEPDGSHSLTAIYPNGKRFSIALGTAQAAAQPSTTANSK